MRASPGKKRQAQLVHRHREDLVSGEFRTALGDPLHAEATRLLLCSGKVAHELRARRRTSGQEHVAVLALEQIYPFPEAELRQMLAGFPRRRELVWVQEEPANMGALAFVRPLLERLAGDLRFTTVKRQASASPATGSAKAHELEQHALLELAFAPLEAERAG